MSQSAERLVSVAIIRKGETHSRGFKTHWELRSALKTDPKQDIYKKITGDEEGFLTSEGRFVNRYEAADIAFEAGQISRPMRRELLSSDIDKW